MGWQRYWRKGKKLVETNKLKSRRQLGNKKQGEKLVIMKKKTSSVYDCTVEDVETFPQ